MNKVKKGYNSQQEFFKNVKKEPYQQPINSYNLNKLRRLNK